MDSMICVILGNTVLNSSQGTDCIVLYYTKVRPFFNSSALWGPSLVELGEPPVIL